MQLAFGIYFFFSVIAFVFMFAHIGRLNSRIYRMNVYSGALGKARNYFQNLAQEDFRKLTRARGVLESLGYSENKDGTWGKTRKPPRKKRS